MEIEALTSIPMDDLTQLPQGSSDGIPNARRCVIRLKFARAGTTTVVEDDGEVDDAVLGLVFAPHGENPDAAPGESVKQKLSEAAGQRELWRYSEE